MAVRRGPTPWARMSRGMTARVTSPEAGAVVLRARARGCGKAKALTVTVDRGVPHLLKPSAKWGETRINLTLPAGAHRIDVKVSGARKCRVLFDRLRLPAPSPRVVAPGSVAPPTVS